MITELNPMQTPPEVEFCREFLNKPPVEKIFKKFEYFSKLEVKDKTDFLDFELKLDAPDFKLPTAEFEGIVLNNALAINAYHTERFAAHSAVIAQVLKEEKEKLDSGDFDEAFNIVAAFLQTRCEHFLFYAIFTLDNVKTDFVDKKNWHGHFKKIAKYNKQFQIDLENLRWFFDLKETADLEKCPF